MKKSAIFLMILIAIILATAFTFTGFVVQQYDAKCVNKEIEITTNKTTTEEITVSMLNIGKKWKKHEVGLNLKHYGLEFEEGQIETTEIINKGETATFSFKLTPTYSGSDEANLTVEYQMKRLKGLATKKQRTRTFGEKCYVYIQVLTTPFPAESKTTIFAPTTQYKCNNNQLCERDSESELSCKYDCAYGNKKYYAKEGSKLVRMPSGYYIKIYEIDSDHAVYIGLDKPHIKPVQVRLGETKDLIEGIRVTNLGVIGNYATIQIEPLE